MVYMTTITLSNYVRLGAISGAMRYVSFVEERPHPFLGDSGSRRRAASVSRGHRQRSHPDSHAQSNQMLNAQTASATGTSSRNDRCLRAAALDHRQTISAFPIAGKRSREPIGRFRLSRLQRPIREPRAPHAFKNKAFKNDRVAGDRISSVSPPVGSGSTGGGRR
jgi:hypothetical protein